MKPTWDLEWHNCDNRTGLMWNGGGQVRSSEAGVLWETRYPEEDLKVLRRKRGSYGWACLMSQDPLPPDSATKFDDAWFHKFSLEEYYQHPEHFLVAITVDGAFNEQAAKKSDRTAISVTAVHFSGAVYLLSITAGKLRPSQIVDTVIEKWKEWPNCEWVGVECDGGGRAIYNDLVDAVERLNLDIWVRALRTKGMPKDARIARLHSRAERCGIYYHDGIKEEYIQEILRYGVAMHRDVPDSIAYRVLSIDEPDAPEEPTEKKSIEYIPHRITGADILDMIEGNSGNGWRPWVCSN